MKPTSIIFLILSVVLLAVGIIICSVSAESADSKGIELICDEIDKDGNAITRDDLDAYNVTSFEINMKDVDINVIRTAKKSYIEFVNINPAVYDYKISNGTMELKTIKPFNIKSFIKLRENGSPFSGLRSYLYLDEYEDKAASVNIYITDTSNVGKMNVTLNNGSISVEETTVNCVYTLETKKGDISFKDMETKGKVKATVKGGDFYADSAYIEALDFTVTGGDAHLKLHRQCRFTKLECDTGIITIDGDEYIEIEKGMIFPKAERAELVTNSDGEEEVLRYQPIDVAGKVYDGDIIITEIPYEAPADLPEEEISEEVEENDAE